jgi:D-amino-acid dehydrogenase
LVIGAGVIGLAVAWHLMRDGAQVTVIDRDAAGDKASFGNAGGIAVSEVIPAAVPGLIWRLPGWLTDPEGPLSVRPAHLPRLLPWLWRFAGCSRPAVLRRSAAALAALHRPLYDDLLPLLSDLGLGTALQRRGALAVYESDAGFARDQAGWALRRELGVTAEVLSGAQARQFEPALGPLVRHAVFTPEWSHVDDPKQLVDVLRQTLLQRGLTLVSGEVTRLGPAGVTLADGRSLALRRLVLAAGAWSGRLAAQLGDPVLLESERGYNTTLPAPGIALSREIIFAERQFVATPLSCGLRIGGAAEFGGLDALPNFRRSKVLTRLAARTLPGLNTAGGAVWAGHRPATPDSLPVIGRSRRHETVLYAFGHGHLGLTQAATTGRIIADLVAGRDPGIDLTPFAAERFA